MDLTVNYVMAIYPYLHAINEQQKSLASEGGRTSMKAAVVSHGSPSQAV